MTSSGDPSSPSAWRGGWWNTNRTMTAVSIAVSE
ncbi:hypothetical protein N825_32700 [Skermanella stibiiresistens SB22]|uniref:Uncharacterized protein n=1 Tax=Skermanella stibiiresistens SB22 TaxID=1385369 RepID=W9HA34_9PROT|nr:hypothetical protein N825_32700 [Skermanella stibiiresistens SB22]